VTVSAENIARARSAAAIVLLKYPNKDEAAMLAQSIETIISAYREAVGQALRMEEVIHQMTKERS
jgi:hypothetical protein